MDESIAREIFENFHEDLDKKIKKALIEADHNGYYSIITQKSYSNRRAMAHGLGDIYYYSYSELYEEMCDLFNAFESGDKNAVYNIITLKNFINYKMYKENVK